MIKAQSVIRLLLAGLAAVACSTTKVLREGEYRLAGNKVEITNDRRFNANELNPYILQKPNSSVIFGWSPFLYVYNWGKADPEKGGLFRKIGEAPVVFDSTQVKSSVDNMLNHLEYTGWYGSSIRSEIEKKKRTVRVKYYVTLGKRIPIGSINYNIDVQGGFAEDFMADTANVAVRPGDFLSEAALEAESERSAQHFRNIGYYGFNKNNYSFEADTISTPGTAALTMSVREFTRNESSESASPVRRYRFGDVTISYGKDLKIREELLQGLNTVRPGALYRERTVNTTYSRLSALNVFSGVNVELSPADSSTVDCRIDLTHSKLQGYKVNLETSTNSSGLMGISPQFSYYHKNIFRGGERLNMSFSGDFQFKPGSSVYSTEFGTSVSVSFPRFVGLSYDRFHGIYIPRTDVALSFNFQDRPEYTRNTFSFSYGFSGSIRNRFFYQVYPIQANIVRLYDIGAEFAEKIETDPYLMSSYSSHIDAGLRGIIYYTTDNDAVPKKSYHYERLQTDLSGNVLSLLNPVLKRDAETGNRLIFNTPYSQYVRFELQLGKTMFFGRRDNQAIALRFLAGKGFAYGNSGNMPFERQFYSGGANSLRGWQARTVGPGTAPLNEYFTIANQTGDTKLEMNAEYRFPLFWKLNGAFFIDAGNVWNTNRYAAGNEKLKWSTLGQSIAVDWGIGLRLDLSFILVRIDTGFQLHDPLYKESYFIPLSRIFPERRMAFHFGVGYPF